MRSGQRWSKLLSLMFALVLMTGCAETKTDVAGGKPAQSGGSVSVNGSSTVFPFSVVAAELFEKANENVRVTVGKKGTGGGFEKFCIGETDISNASRPIKKSEIDKCVENNVEYIELTVCIDGLTVCVNPANNWCDCLSVEQLKALWEPSSKIKKWKELNPAWPDENIELFGADSDSGTFDYFTEVIVGKSKSSRSDYTASSEDNTLVQGIEGDKYALGYFGFSYYDKNRKKLKAIGIIPAKGSAAVAPSAADKPGCEGAVLPSLETIEKGEYTPLSRPLFVYVNKKALKRPEVAGYVKVLLGNAQDYVEKAGFIKLKETLLKEQQEKLEAELADVKTPKPENTEKK